MNRIATFLLGILALGLVVVIVFVKPLIGSQRDTRLHGDYVLSFELDEVRGFRIIEGEDVVLEFTREGEVWHMGPTPADRAGVEQVHEVLSLAQNLRIVDVIRGPEFDRHFRSTDFGLSNPKQRLKVDLEERSLELLIGREGAAEATMFVRRGDSKDTFTVPDGLRDSMSKAPREFRDRRLTELAALQMAKVRVRRPSGDIEIEKRGDHWWITRPLQAPADPEAVSGLLERLLGARVLEFTPEADVDTAPLHTPEVEVSIWAEGDIEPRLLRLGPETTWRDEEPARRAIYTGRPSVLLLPAGALEFIEATPAALRDRKLLRLNLDTVDILEIRRQEHSPVRLRRGEEDWVLVREDGEKAVSHALVAAFADGLTELRIEEFLPYRASDNAERGLETPLFEIDFSAWLSENTPEAAAGRHPVALVRIGRAEDGTVHARVNEAPEVFVLPADTIAMVAEFTESFESVPSAAATPTPTSAAPVVESVTTEQPATQ